MTTSALSSFAQRFQSLQAHRYASEELIKDLLDYVQNMETSLMQENRQLQEKIQMQELDIRDATDTRRALQLKLREYEENQVQVMHQNDILKNRNPYIVVLIDGDGLFFKDSLLQRGVEGGKRAANMLRSAVAAQCRALQDEVEIICKVCANLSGLGKAMRRDGAIQNENDLKEFSLGFTQAKASFDFIDVGHGKERADSKIQETTRFHLRNFNCKQILLGVSHDAGYAPFLDEICRDESTKNRITILEGYPTHQEIRSIKIHTLNFTKDLFRPTKLVDHRRPSFPQASPLMAMSIPVAPQGPATAYDQSAFYQQSPQPAPLAQGAANFQPVESPPPSQHSQPSQSSQSSQPSHPSQPPQPAAVFQTVPNRPDTLSPAPSAASTQPDPPKRAATPPPTITLPMKIKPVNSRNSKPSTASKVIPPPMKPWNPGQRGLDIPLQLNPAVLDQIKRRRDSDKLCNNHYLRGPCSKGEECCFEHNYNPSKEERAVISYLARLNPCTNGQKCDVEDCIYGHHCPSTREGVCRHPHCKFREDEHPPGTKYITKLKKQASN